MIRIALRQFRTQGLMGIGFLVAVAIVLAITGPHLVHLYDTSVLHCSSHGDCPGVISSFRDTDHGLQLTVNDLVIAVPGIIGIFWGAPLIAKELEEGTFRLAWTQSVSRSRWLIVKLALVGIAAMATAGLMSLMATWWSSPFDRLSASTYPIFDQRDIAPIGYAAFAFALGATAGILIRRTLPGMATTLVGFIFMRVAFFLWVRPHLLPAKSLTSPLTIASVGFGSVNGGPITLQPNGPDIANAWVLSSEIVNHAGQQVTKQYLQSACPTLQSTLSSGVRSVSGLVQKQAIRQRVGQGMQNALQECVAKVGSAYHEVSTYQPGYRYWEFQWMEMGIFLALAIGLCGICLWQVRRRLS